MLWVTRGRNPAQTILNDNGLKWTHEMGDLRGGAACRQDPPSQQFPRTQFLHPSTWPLRLTCLAVLQEIPPAPGSTALLAPKERLCPSKCPKGHSDWTNPGHASTPEPIPAARGRVCVDWLA